MNGASVLEDGCVIGVVECVHDIRVVCPLEESGWATVADCGTRQLGDRVL